MIDFSNQHSLKERMRASILPLKKYWDEAAWSDLKCQMLEALPRYSGRSTGSSLLAATNVAWAIAEILSAAVPCPKILPSAVNSTGRNLLLVCGSKVITLVFSGTKGISLTWANSLAVFSAFSLLFSLPTKCLFGKEIRMTWYLELSVLIIDTKLGENNIDVSLSLRKKLPLTKR